MKWVEKCSHEALLCCGCWVVTLGASALAKNAIMAFQRAPLCLFPSRKCYPSNLINKRGNNFSFSAQSLLSNGSQSSFSPSLRFCVLCHSCSPSGHLLPLYQLIHNYPASLCAFLFGVSPLFPLSVNLFLSLSPRFLSLPLHMPSLRGPLIHLLST